MAVAQDARKPFNFAHLLTILRLVLTPCFLLAIASAQQQSSLWPVLHVLGLFLIICASDYYDGPVARALERDSAFGKVFDNLADITFLLVTLTYLGHQGTVPWWIPTAVALAFLQYTVDSWLLAGRGKAVVLVANPIGHWAGILNYLLTGLMALNTASQGRLLLPVLSLGVCVLWLAYLLLAMGIRFRFFLRMKQVVIRAAQKEES